MKVFETLDVDLIQTAHVPDFNLIQKEQPNDITPDDNEWSPHQEKEVPDFQMLQIIIPKEPLKLKNPHFGHINDRQFFEAANLYLGCINSKKKPLLLPRQRQENFPTQKIVTELYHHFKRLKIETHECIS